MIKRTHYEDDLQRAAAQYLDLKGYLWTHAPNGARMGGRDPAITCARLKRMGLKAGVPDILIFEHWISCGNPDCPGCTPHIHCAQRRSGPGLAIELKSPKGRLTPEQKQWLAALQSKGWHTTVCRTINEVTAVCELIG